MPVVSTTMAALVKEEMKVDTGSRGEKVNTPAIGESIKMVANQLLQGNRTPPPATGEGSMVDDVRTPPRMKNQQANKVKVTKQEPDKTEVIENSHAGVAVPMLVEEVDIIKNEQIPINKVTQNKETSTTDEGLSTWILLSGSPTTPKSKNTNKKNETNSSKEKNDDNSSKENKKPPQNKAKPRPPGKPTRVPAATVAPKPIFNRKPVAIGSSNKSDLIASGSAVNENVMNKIKAQVLANVQKNKFAALNRNTTSVPSSTASPITQASTTTTVGTTKKPPTLKATTEAAIVVTLSPIKLEKIKVSVEKKSETKKNENKREKPVTQRIENLSLEESVSNDISMESKNAEIELEVSTPPPSTTKKPKRNSGKRKKNKNRRRKPANATSRPDSEMESKIENKTKVATKNPPKDKPITTQIYNYLSREVMPSVGVGIMSIAGLVGIASYFLYPFTNVVRRAYDANDRKDDLYQQNGELYATAEGGQTEEEMLGSFFPEIPSHSNNNNRNVNPYAGQTQFMYPQTKKQDEQNIRYRNVAYGSEINSYSASDRVGQQGIDGMQGASYSENIHYDTHMPEQQERFSSYQQPQPVYKPAQSDVSEPIYSTDSVQASYSTIDNLSEPTYGQALRYSQEIPADIQSNPISENLHPVSDPTYGQALRYSQELTPDTTKNPIIETLHLGVDDVIEKQKETGYTVAAESINDNKQPQFVVGNIPKELIQAVTPITVPEHGPRSLRIRKRSINLPEPEISGITSTADSLKEVLQTARENKKEPDQSKEANQLKNPVIVSISGRRASQSDSKVQSSPLIEFDIPVDEKKSNDNNSSSTTKYELLPVKTTEKTNNPEIKITKTQTTINIPQDNIVSTQNVMDITTVETIIKNKDRKLPMNDMVANSNPTAQKANVISITDIGSMLATRKHGTPQTTDDGLSNELDGSISDLVSENNNDALIESKIQPNNELITNNSNLKIKNPDSSVSSPDSTTKLAPLFIEVSTEKEESTPESFEKDDGSTESTTMNPNMPAKPENPDVEEYPDPTQKYPKPFSILNFLRHVVDFKYRLGMSILQTTSESLARYLRGMEGALKTAARASENIKNVHYHRE